MAAPRFHDLTLKSVRNETSDAVALMFDIPDDLNEAYAFTPGQYLTLRADIDGQDVRRSYSICSPLGQQMLEVGIKHIEDGVFSSFAMGLKAGDQVRVMTPQGRFMAPVGGEHHYLLLAAGSGVTPMISIARSVLEGEPNSTVTMCYANRTTDSVMFRTTLDDLKDRFLTRFLLTHVMDEETQDVALFNGRLDGEKLASLATGGVIHPKDYDAVYICGPQPMIDAASTAMTEMGVPKNRLKFELFTPAGGTPIAGAAPKTKVKTQDATAEVVLDGATRKFAIGANETVVEAAAKVGLELPYSCKNGMCATCRCKLVEGEATMVQNFSLEPWELKDGFVLACQTKPVSNHIKLDFDAV